jgi:hypothetical protein
MGTIGSGLLAAAVGVAVLAPSAASANVISEPFTITQLPAVRITWVFSWLVKDLVGGRLRPRAREPAVGLAKPSEDR